jgi:hypothetical protein
VTASRPAEGARSDDADGDRARPGRAFNELVASGRVFVLLCLAWGGGPAAAEWPAEVPAASCLTDGQVNDILALEGVFYLAGAFSHVRPPGTEAGGPEEEERRWFAACDAATGAVLPWDPLVDCTEGNCTNADGRALAVSGDGQWLYLVGKFRTVGGLARRHAARVSPSTAAVDAAWDPDPDDRVQAVRELPDGRILLAGNFTHLGPGALAQAHLAAVAPADGTPDEDFAPVIEAAGFTTVLALDLSPDGSTLYLGGQLELVNGAPRDGAAAVDAATGTLTAPFAPELTDTNPNDPFVQVREIRVDDSWVYLCGDWWETEGVGSESDQRNVNRFDPQDGSVDPSFWVGTDGGVQACALDRTLDVLFVGGHFDCVVKYVNGVPEPGGTPCGSQGTIGWQQRDLFALRLADGAMIDWNPDTGGIPGTWALEVGGGRLAAGGGIFWPRTGEATSENLVVFDLPLFLDGFESGDTGRWSSTSE